MRPYDDASGELDREHGAHTLRVWEAVVVGVHGDDVFLELGPRMQGVLSRRNFDEDPRLGEEVAVTLLGQEDGLWAVARVEEGLLASWRDMEVGSWVQGRVTGTNPGGLELKIGPLHAFMPKSETGLDRGDDAGILVGKTITCEVIEIDRERQRVFVSRKSVERKQKESERQRQAGTLKPGQIIQGRVSRIEAYGAFVRFGNGLEGMVHISNISREHIEHPGDVLKKGQQVEAEVLTVRHGGKRVGLGLKQLQHNPWKEIARTHAIDQVVLGRVNRTTNYGAFLSIAKGVEGLLHESESGLDAERRLRDVVRPGQSVAVRIVSIDVEEERMGLSRVHANGAMVRREEIVDRARLDDLKRDEDANSTLGPLLRRALAETEDPLDPSDEAAP